MPANPPNVKIYDRPERKGPGPILYVAVVGVVIAALFVYLFYTHRLGVAPARHVSINIEPFSTSQNVSWAINPKLANVNLAA